MGCMRLVLTNGRFWEWPNAINNENTVGVAEENIVTGPCSLFARGKEPAVNYCHEVHEQTYIVVRMCEVFQWGA